jgi:hypothetical protein
MKLSRKEVILIYLTSVDLPGKELIHAMWRTLPRLLELEEREPITREELDHRIVEIYEDRSEILLRSYALNNGHDPASIVGVKASLFREHLLTHVMVDPTKVGRWEFLESVENLPWFEPYLVINNGQVARFTADHVLDMDWVSHYKETITKAEVDDIVKFLNRKR